MEEIGNVDVRTVGIVDPRWPDRRSIPSPVPTGEGRELNAFLYCLRPTPTDLYRTIRCIGSRG